MPRVAVLDTTVQIDRRKGRGRRDAVESLLSGFAETIATGIAMVEFKAVLIQECIFIHNQLRRAGSRFTRVRDAISEKQHPQAKLRSHIFNNLIILAGSSFELTDEEDCKLAMKARLKLENTIPELYLWFRDTSATVFLNNSRIRCDRAKEPPKKDGVAFAVNLPRCRRGKNKTCNAEELVRQHWPIIKAAMPIFDPADDSVRQLIAQQQVLDAVVADPKFEMSVEDCRRAGDSLICVEVFNIATHSVSTNARDWSVLSPAANMEFVPVTYPEEASR